MKREHSFKIWHQIRMVIFIDEMYRTFVIQSKDYNKFYAQTLRNHYLIRAKGSNMVCLIS